MPANLDAILKLEVPVIVQIADRTMPAEEVLALSLGAIIELPKQVDEDLEILVNNKTIGIGRAVKVGENFGVRVVYVGDLRQRVAALGAVGDDQPAEEQRAGDPPVETLAEQLTADQ